MLYCVSFTKKFQNSHFLDSFCEWLQLTAVYYIDGYPLLPAGFPVLSKVTFDLYVLS